jgi:hypothetical protein
MHITPQAKFYNKPAEDFLTIYEAFGSPEEITKPSKAIFKKKR